ncbi:MAG: carbohydrate-binding domain-containing protein [Lachnospiraceae bacterium]|nr:carbohydrate-binding domain-containing protein [Lachnospiraceae bacterium]
MDMRRVLAGISGLAVAGALLMGGCASEASVPAGSQGTETKRMTFSSADLETGFEEAQEIDLAEETEIRAGGAYRLTGSTDRTVVVEAEDQIVRLLLDQVTIHAQDGPGLEIRSAGKVIITRLEGTENTISDGPRYTDKSNANAALFSQCDLTINGEGALTVEGYYKDAIHTKDVFRLHGGKLTVKAKRTGIRGNDGMLLADGTVQIEAEGNGLQTVKVNDHGKGQMNVENIDGSIIAGAYGMNAAAGLYLSDNRITMQTVRGDYQADGGIEGQTG